MQYHPHNTDYEGHGSNSNYSMLENEANNLYDSQQKYMHNRKDDDPLGSDFHVPAHFRRGKTGLMRRRNQMRILRRTFLRRKRRQEHIINPLQRCRTRKILMENPMKDMPLKQQIQDSTAFKNPCQLRMQLDLQ